MRRHTTPSRPRISKQPGAYIIALVIGTGLVASASCSPKPGRTPEAPLAIRVKAARYGTITQRLEYVGTVHSQREVKVLARVQGTVVDLPVVEGGLAREGSVIARLDARDLAASYQQTEAELSRAGAERDHQCHWYRQHRALGASGAVSKLAVDRYRKGCEAATAAYGAARAGRSLRGAIAAKTVERAPFAGRVLQWLSEPGQNLLPGQPILLLGNEALEIRVRAVESDFGRSIRVGTPVQVTFGGSIHLLRVDEIAPMARGLGRTVEVKIHIPGATGTAPRNGASINVSFVIAQEERAVIVPAHAVRRHGSESAIFVIQGKSVRRVPVTLGVRSGSTVAIHGDLPRQLVVAISNVDMLGDGARVYPVLTGDEEP